MSIWTWFGKLFKSVKTDGAKIAVAITEGVQDALKSGIVGELAGAISAIFPNVKNLPQEVVNQLQKVVPRVLAAELALQGMPDNPTDKDILDFENKVLTAFNVHDNKSKLYTMLAAQVYDIITQYSHGKKLTFGNLVTDVEAAYQDYLRDKAEADAEADQNATE